MKSKKMRALGMVVVFSSGSCRLLSIIRKGYDIIYPLHALNTFSHRDDGINFLGKLHNVKQHIQFIRYINGSLHIPDDILPSFLVSYSAYFPTAKEVLLQKCKALSSGFLLSDLFIFEICSLRMYEKNGFQLQHELNDTIPYYEQTPDDLYNDLQHLCDLIPQSKPIVFVCHFRPNIIEGNKDKAILNREIIYETLTKFEKEHSNVYVYDPSLFLSLHRNYYDGDNHYYDAYSKEIFLHMFDDVRKGFLSKGIHV